MDFIEKIGNTVSKNLTVLVILMAAYSFFVPSTFLWVTPNMGTFLSIMMFGVGMTIKAEQFKFVLERPKDIFIGAICQYTIMPFVALAISKLLNLSPEITLGLILVGSCPGGISSNVMTYLAKGDVALSVSLTTVSTLLAPIVTPILTLFLAGTYLDVSISAMFISIVKIVLIPLILAGICNSYLPKVGIIMTKCLPLSSSILLIFLVSGSISGSADIIRSTGLLVLLSVVLLHGFGSVLGYTLAKILGLEENKRRTVALEVGMQNSGLATALAFAHFSPAVAVSAALSGPWQTIFSAMLANYWAKKPMKLENTVSENTRIKSKTSDSNI